MSLPSWTRATLETQVRYRLLDTSTVTADQAWTDTELDTYINAAIIAATPLGEDNYAQLGSTSTQGIYTLSANSVSEIREVWAAKGERSPLSKAQWSPVIGTAAVSMFIASAVTASASIPYAWYVTSYASMSASTSSTTLNGEYITEYACGSACEAKAREGSQVLFSNMRWLAMWHFQKASEIKQMLMILQGRVMPRAAAGGGGE